ncbi:Protein zyg-11 like [Schistosoma japonicum]|nr:Protein zyg-11 like [Schistosoma japonicum]
MALTSDSYIKKDALSSLEDLCVRCVCKNLNVLTYLSSENGEVRRKWRFPYQGFRLVARPSQKILLQLCKRNALDDDRMSLFTADSVDLMSPVIKEANVSPTSLKVLRDFHLYSLSAMNLTKVNLNTIISCLSEWTVQNLMCLNISGTSILCETHLPILVALGRFKNLSVLNASRTELSTQCLQIIADDLSNLRYLNISRTRVTDITPLLSIRDRLNGLIMHRLQLERTEDIAKLLHTVVELNQLRILDVSDKPRNANGRYDAVDRICSPEALPLLEHIDLSGNQFGFKLSDARALLENHPRLTFAGFASWLSSHEHELEGIYRLSHHYPHITAVLRVMRLHLRRMEMILAGTAVIYNLTRSEQSNQLPLDLLNRAVRMTLTAMEKFPDNRQLQKNCFLTLCSDTVLYRATFNCIQCCELVFNNLLSFDDIHMKRMGVAIISILAAEISTSGLSDLAKDPRRIECLLSYVADKCLLVADVPDLGSALRSYMPQLRFRTEGAPIFDTTLRFTLSALWNLTDECPEACLRFVHQGGLIIYEKVLKRFADQNEETKNHVYTKCLGLLNNVAEVEQTRESLLKESLMNFFFKMLRHPCIQISYFAAGIIAHLSCLKDDIWLRNIQSSRESYIKLLGQAVCNWQPPHSEMVAYRSFEPFGLLVLHPEKMRYVPVLCECQPLLSFLRLVVSLDETALCAHSLQRQISNQDSHNVKSHFHDDNADDNVGNNDMESGDLIKSPVSCDIIHAQTSSVYSPSDHFSEVSVCDCFISENQQAQSSRHLSATIGHAEPVGQSAEGVAAFVGPDESQLACARLIRKMASEILTSVDRTLPTLQSTSLLPNHNNRHCDSSESHS